MKLDIDSAYKVLQSIVFKTPLQFHAKLSESFGAKIFIKREDLQVVRSYKIRGAYYLIQSLNSEEKKEEWFVQVQAITPKVLPFPVNFCRFMV